MTSRPRIWFPTLHRAEGTHAVWQPIFRKETSVLEARRAQAEPERNLGSGLWLKIDLPDPVWDAFAELARRHGPCLGIRTLDSRHVALALEFEAPVL